MEAGGNTGEGTPEHPSHSCQEEVEPGGQGTGMDELCIAA